MDVIGKTVKHKENFEIYQVARQYGDSFAIALSIKKKEKEQNEKEFKQRGRELFLINRINFLELFFICKKDGWRCEHSQFASYHVVKIQFVWSTYYLLAKKTFTII